jgi:hypothetical protein
MAVFAESRASREALTILNPRVEAFWSLAWEKKRQKVEHAGNLNTGFVYPIVLRLSVHSSMCGVGLEVTPGSATLI